MNDLLLAAATAAGGLVTGVLILLAVRKRNPPAAKPEEVVPLEVVAEETVVPVRRDATSPSFDDAPFTIAQAPAPAPRPMAAQVPLLQTHAPRRPALVLNRGIGPTYDPDDPPELPDSPIPTEWARRLLGNLGAGRTRGVCSGCGTHLSISQQRPVRIACPVCGRTRLLGA